MIRIMPHLWYDKEAVEAARLYTSTFPNSKMKGQFELKDTPSGDARIVQFELFGQPFQAINAGPMFTFNPSMSMMVYCESADEVDEYYGALHLGGKDLMPLDAYPFSPRYVWFEDRYGLSWQLMYRGPNVPNQRIALSFLFSNGVCGKAGEAIETYTKLFPNSDIEYVSHYGEGEAELPEASINYASFQLNNVSFVAMDNGYKSDFTFNEALSIMVICDTQEEIDLYFDTLSKVPEAEQCGWLKDAYGVSWQVAPHQLGAWMDMKDPEMVQRLVKAFLPMKKLDIAALSKVVQGEE